MLHFSQNLISLLVDAKSLVTFFIMNVDASGGVFNFPVKVSACFSWRKTIA
jgi:hypothetical protein